MDKLFAFWACERFPYVEGDEIVDIRDDGMVRDKGQTGWYPPLILLPLEAGCRIEHELDDMTGPYSEAIYQAEATWRAQVTKLMPSLTSALRLDHQAPEPAPDEEPPAEPDTQSLTLVTMLKLSQAGIITKGPDADADGLSFCLTPKGGKLIGDLIEAARVNDTTPILATVKVSPEENPAVDGQLPDIKFVPQEDPKDEPEPDLSEPRECDCPHCGRMFEVIENDLVDKPEPPPSEIAAGLKESEQAVLLLCRKSRSVKFMGSHSRPAEGTLYKVKCDLVRRGLVTEALVREANSKCKLWCLTDAGREVVVELLKGRNPK
jgi:hypothetical protein